MVVRTRGLALIAAAFVGVASMTSSGVILAQTSAPGITITPAFQELDLPASQPKLTYDISIQNSSTISQLFHLSLVDFGSLDESGGLEFLGQSTSQLEDKFGLAKWMSLPSAAVVVPGGQTVTLPVTITNDSTLAPGGHYGAVLATIDSSESSSKGPNVGLRQVLSSLVLLTKEGGLIQRLNLAGQTDDAHLWKLPTQVTQRFHNTGNVHLVPYGVVEVEDPARRLVERNAINDGSVVILPDSYRQLTTQFLNTDAAWMPGRYRLISTYEYDGSSQTKTFVTTFWYAGLAVVWIVSLLFVAAVIFWAWWFYRAFRKRA